MSRDDESARRCFERLTLQDALELWSEEWEKNPPAPRLREHASPEQLRSMAEPDGMAKAEPELVDHVSRCPSCLSEWAALIRAASGAEESRSVAGLDYGVLEAAATGAAGYSRTLRTVGGTYVLTLSPGAHDSSSGLVILEVAAPSVAEHEGRRIEVRARASGEVLLDGIVRRGSLARRHENPAAIDLSRGWTVVVDIRGSEDRDDPGR